MMMKSLARIEGYLDNDLTHGEVEEFELQLLSDRRLSRELSLVREINGALAEAEVLALRDSLGRISLAYRAEAAEPRSGVVRFYNNPLIYRVAATLLLLIGTSLIYMNLFTLKPDQVLDRYLQPYPSIYAVRSANQDIELSEIVEAMNPYVQGDYLQAKENLASLMARDSQRVDLQFYYGICQLELGEGEGALASFDRVIASGNHIFMHHAHWYRAMSLLEMEEKPAAREAFRSIAAMNNSFSKDARRIVRRLK